MKKSWQEIDAQLREEALARGQRYRDIEAQCPEAALNDLKLQSCSPIWEDSFFHRFMTMSDQELEANVVWHQEIREIIKKQNEEYNTTKER